MSGKTARLRFGKAGAPKNAPLAVKRAIWAANQLRHKPYRYGGGHKSFDDRGYDCSGTISYVLGTAGLISSPMSSTEFRSYGDRGSGKWITIYAREGHTFAVIAGLRFDTTLYDRYIGKWASRWQTIYRPPRGFDARHPVGLNRETPTLRFQAPKNFKSPNFKERRLWQPSTINLTAGQPSFFEA